MDSLSYPAGYINIRDTSGRIIGTGQWETTTVPVLSLGAFLDRFVDDWGFDLKGVLCLVRCFADARDEEEFVEMIANDGMRASEAHWFWSYRDDRALRAHRYRNELRVL